MPKIRLESIEFSQPPFRKLGNIKISFSKRITLISGHNGIGKSTILGLVSNSSGLTRKTAAPRSFFEKYFEANLSEIIFVDYDNEFLSAKADNTFPNPIITYSINDDEELKKRCGLAEREGKARIVPRNYEPSVKFTSKAGDVNVGDSSKVPLPTIYLGLTRVLPVGEAEEETVYNDQVKISDPADISLMVDFINGVVTGVGAKSGSVTSNRIKGTTKFSSHPTYSYDSKCVSVGQDSLGSIATALASFQMLKRTWTQYPGGLLVIDELDSGLHPHAIRRLVKKLQDIAEDLDIQIVATTHSPALIESIFTSSSNKKPKDSIAYLLDTAAPRLMNPAGLRNILDDMELVPPTSASTPKSKVRVYLEDNEAKELFDLLVPASLKRKLNTIHGVSIKSYSLGVGCDSLANLSSIDPRFQECIFALDADATIKARHLKFGNIVKLPGSDGKSPERTLFAFANSLINLRSIHTASWEKLAEKNITTDQIQTHLLDWQGDVSKRTEAKKWWRDRRGYLSDWKIFQIWMSENTSSVDQFRDDFSTAVQTVSKRLRKLAKLKIES